MKHTPGPWEVTNVYPKREPYYIAEGKGNAIACTMGGSRQDQANANLIAAAPELLEALRLAEATLAANLSQSDALPEIRAALAKAEGKAKV